jgi:hypothetical protein
VARPRCCASTRIDGTPGGLEFDPVPGAGVDTGGGKAGRLGSPDARAALLAQYENGQTFEVGNERDADRLIQWRRGAPPAEDASQLGYDLDSNALMGLAIARRDRGRRQAPAARRRAPDADGGRSLVRRLAIGLVAVAMATGCGGGSGGGVEQVSSEGLTLEHPEGWDAEDLSGEDGMVLNVRGPANDAGVFVRLTAFRQARSFASVGQYGGVTGDARAAELDDATVNEPEQVRVEGIGDAARLTTDFRLTTDDGERLPGRIVELLALSADDQWRVSIAGPRQAVSAPDVRRVLESVRIRP